MKIWGLLVLCLSTVAWAGLHGEDFESSASIGANELVAEAEKYSQNDVVVQTKVAKVCKMKGCWFEIKADAQKTPLKVVFKDYGFFVPKDIDGKTVTMKGRLEKKKMSVKMQRHYLKDEGASEAEIQAIKKPVEVYQFVASGVKIES